MTYEDMVNMQCERALSDLSDTHHGHITTGNLDIIRDRKLRQICSYGTKYREVPSLNKTQIKDRFRVSIDELISKLVRKFRIPMSRLKSWQDKFISLVSQRIDYLGFTNRWNTPVLGDRQCREELDRLQSKFVITVVDKAAGNFAFTCKKFYLLRLAQELGLNNR